MQPDNVLDDNSTLMDCFDLFTKEELLSGNNRPVSMNRISWIERCRLGDWQVELDSKYVVGGLGSDVYT